MNKSAKKDEKRDKIRGYIFAGTYTVAVILLLFLIAFKGVQEDFIEIEMGMEPNSGFAESGGMVESGSIAEDQEQPSSEESNSSPSSTDPLLTDENDVDLAAPEENSSETETNVSDNTGVNNDANSDEASEETNSPTTDKRALFNKDKFQDGPPSDDDGRPDVLDGGGENPGDGELEGVKGYGNNPLGNGDGLSKFIPTNNTDYRGEIYVEVTVDQQGNVVDAKVKGNLSDPGWSVLESEVIAAAKKWKFPEFSANTSLKRKGELVFNFEKQ